MRGLSAKDVLEVWERGVDATDVERGLLMLSYCYPEKSWTELAEVSIGRRDAMLLELRCATSGPVLKVFAVCPGCAGQLEFEVNDAEIGLSSANKNGSEIHSFTEGAFFVRCRLPDSTDLQVIGDQCKSVEEARRLIFSRCAHAVQARGQTWAPNEVPEAVIDRFGAYFSEQEPEAEILLNLECPACGRRWELLLDIVSYFWREIQTAARRIVLEVDALARSYGWCEAEILSMSPARRQLYLEMVG